MLLGKLKEKNEPTTRPRLPTVVVVTEGSGVAVFVRGQND
jgi:hypothetical protein